MATPILVEAAREVLKGTLVPLELPERLTESPHGLVKLGIIRQLALRPGESDAVERALSGREHPERPGRERPDPPPERREAIPRAAIELLREFEDPLLGSLAPDARRVAHLPTAELHAFIAGLIQVRSNNLRRSAQETSFAQESSFAAVGRWRESLNAAVVAGKALAANTAAQPIGVLNLERIEMVPSGIQRGELVATIPLAPGEKTAVTHKEWSVTSKEFTTIVTDSLEEVSETGVTDNTDLSQATSSQSQHSNQANITGHGPGRHPGHLGIEHRRLHLPGLPVQVGDREHQARPDHHREGLVEVTAGAQGHHLDHHRDGDVGDVDPHAAEHQPAADPDRLLQPDAEVAGPPVPLRAPAHLRHRRSGAGRRHAAGLRRPGDRCGPSKGRSSSRSGTPTSRPRSSTPTATPPPRASPSTSGWPTGTGRR